MTRASALYLPVRAKFVLACLVATGWSLLSVRLAERWFDDLAALTGPSAALFLILFIAIAPGFMNAFVLASLLLDRRPPRRPPERYPDVTILVAAYNEEEAIAETLGSIARQEYPAQIDAIVVDDGSRDATPAHARSMLASMPRLRLIELSANGGKAAALNVGLAQVRTALFITI